MAKLILSVDQTDTNRMSGPYGQSVAIATCSAIEEYFDPADVLRKTGDKLNLLELDYGGDDVVHHCVITPSLHMLPERSYVAYDVTGGDPYAIAASLPKEDLMSLFEVTILLRAHLQDDPPFLATKETTDEYTLSNYFFVAGRNEPVWLRVIWDDLSDNRWDWPERKWILEVQPATNKIKYNKMGTVKRSRSYSGRYIFRHQPAIL